MDSSNYRGSPSTAAIGCHAIQSIFVIFVAFSIAFLGVLATDPAIRGTGDHFDRRQRPGAFLDA
jgi:hypothetical protein